MNNRKSLAMLGAVALSMASSFSSADDERSGLELGLGYSHSEYDQDGSDLIDNGEGIMGHLGYRFNDLFSVELKRSDVSHDVNFTGDSIDAVDTSLNALFHFNGGGTVEPFLSAGVGEYEAEFGGESGDGTSLTVGAGLKIFMNEVVHLRPELFYRDVDGDIDDNFAGAHLALSFLLGGNTKAPAAPKVADTDNDGVADAIDSCPGTPQGVAVDSAGCPLDSDGDGVYDYIDQCPDTEAKLKVDDQGCALLLTESVSIEMKVLFDTNSAVVKPAYYEEIRKVATFLEEYKGTTVVVEGHTDSSGSADYNRKLSQRRADAVAKVLVDSLGVDASRVSAVGYGEDKPIADNSTKEGQERNRRVVGEISTEYEIKQKK